MAVTIRERVKSRQFTIENGEGSGRLLFLVMGTNSEDEARGAVIAGTPTGMFGVSRLAIDCDPLGAGMWDATVNYGTRTATKAGLGADTPTEFPPPPPPPAEPPDPPPAYSDPPAPLPILEAQPGAPGDGTSDPSGGTGGAGESGQPATPEAISPTQTIGPEFSFDTSGSTQHLTQSKGTVYRRGLSEDEGEGGIDPETGEEYFLAPDLGGAIGASRDGVAGVDIVAPKLEVTLTRTVRSITPNYIRTCAELTGRVNNATFMGGFEEGEALCLGVTGNYREPDGWTMTYKFLIARNRKDVVIVGPGTEGGSDQLKLPAVEGHQHVWVTYGPTIVGDTKKRHFQTPRAAYVEVLYDKGDFSKFGFV